MAETPVPEIIRKTYARIPLIHKDNEEYALTLFALKRMCNHDMTDPEYKDKVTAIALEDGWRLYVLNNGYELVGPTE